MEVKIHYEGLVDLPRRNKEFKIDDRVRSDTGRRQLKAVDILDFLIVNKIAAKDAFCTMAIINEDLYPREGWTFVFGLARKKASLGL